MGLSGKKTPYDPPIRGMNHRYNSIMTMLYYGNRELVKNARELRCNMTLAEIILWSRLRSKKVDGHKFRRQQPILNYIADFYCNELKLIIEVDREIHSLPEKKESDKKRDKLLNINGYNILHLTNLECETEIDSAINNIKSFIITNLSPSQGDRRGSSK